MGMRSETLARVNKLLVPTQRAHVVEEAEVIINAEQTRSAQTFSEVVDRPARIILAGATSGVASSTFRRALPGSRLYRAAGFLQTLTSRTSSASDVRSLEFGHSITLSASAF
jgi:hypothetical protein